MVFVCTCRDQSPPYDNLGAQYEARWWVHRECGLPKEAWLRSLGDDMLNFFRGGPLDGTAYATSTLLDRKDLMIGYSWTPDVIVGRQSGSTARVWLYGEVPLAAAMAPQSEQQDQLNEKEESTVGTLEDRRKALKLSRSKIAERAGLTQAVVYRIEQETGRTTDEEKAQLAGVLSQFEAEAAAAPPAEANAGDGGAAPKSAKKTSASTADDPS